jgi:hypothetical protein
MAVTTPNCSQVKTLVRTTSTQMSFPEMISDILCRISLVVQTHSFISCPGGGLAIPQVKQLDVEVLGWPDGSTAIFSKTTLEAERK